MNLLFELFPTKTDSQVNLIDGVFLATPLVNVCFFIPHTQIQCNHPTLNSVFPNLGIFRLYSGHVEKS